MDLLIRMRIILPAILLALALLVNSQECLNVEDVEKCMEDLTDIIEDPSEILGHGDL